MCIRDSPGFALGIAMSSNRIENYETINGENLCAWYTGDGMTYLYDNDLAQYSDSFWPTVNPYLSLIHIYRHEDAVPGPAVGTARA